MSMSDDGLLVMVVEDEPVLAIGYEMAIEDAGCRHVTAGSLTEGMEAVSDEIDVAILDIRLGQEKVFPLAYVLVERGVPFLFCSGTAGDMPEGIFSEVPLLHKPINANVVVAKAIELATR